nr:hypothetical protein Iba_chr06aCG0720 [Ipomoea batatas]GMD05032.1 hypothetical protein Iba_chr06bCG2780 [Ipomoea batatas]GMD07088.1 hypothetical protein Iba_chr06cCG3830 [Ipomoea batatas]GMD08663.1 hypothetical protein Iba_chr06dCG0660 [Ipomoea batatas]GMD09847.1 hypothetical protein Iba_chr06eCG0550 [Ipomoea batatas]
MNKIQTLKEQVTPEKGKLQYFAVVCPMKRIVQKSRGLLGQP